MKKIDRIAGLRSHLKGIDGFLASNLKNIQWLSGFAGSNAYAIITKKDRVFLTDFRYQEEVAHLLHGWDIVILKKTIPDIARICKQLGIKRLGFENSVSFAFFEKLSKNTIALKPFDGLIEKLRAVKEADEILAMKIAISRAESAFLRTLPYIKKGSTEINISRRLDDEAKKLGSKKPAFETIVASGPNSSMPHARASEKKLSAGDLVVIDWGAEADGYFSDTTRTLLLKGSSIQKQIEIYNIVLEANLKAIRAVKPGATAKAIDKTARDVITKAGYGPQFGHGTGHGIGMEVHERPNLSTKSSDVVKQGMIFTVEPGIYLPGTGGVRIEDMVFVTKNGNDVLTSLPKELKIIV